MSKIQLYQGDCLEIMQQLIDQQIKVDTIITDPPYGTTACKWDNIIPFKPMWNCLNKLIKDNGAIVLFGNEPFTSTLITSNIKSFKYRINWDKVIPSGMGYAKYRPMSQIEDICIFSKNGKKVVYNPQMIKRDKSIQSGGNTKPAGVYSGFKCIGVGKEYKKTYEYKNPTTLIKFDKIRRGATHPTQKPIALMEYLIKTYSNEGDTILDFTMGSGSTGVACKNTKRNFIGIELNEEYFKIAKQRIEETK